MQSFAPTRLFTGDAFIEGGGVVVDKGRIVKVMTTPPAGAIELEGVLAPGFIDVQVNGGGGVLFNDAPKPDTLATIAAAHRRFGVTGFMATLISDERAKIAMAIDAVSQALKSGVDGVLGLHLEGPWLSERRRGVHPAEHLREIDAADMELLTQPRAFPLMVTVAPERIDLAGIESLADAGVIVSLGHTAAPAEVIAAALAAGATGFTHLFNAMPPLEGRNPGAVGAALSHAESWAGLILDGVHVHPLSARAALAAKTASKLMLVSDAMSTVGSSEASMSLFGEPITMGSGALRTAAGTLAGAHLDMSTAVRNAVTLLKAPLADALRMAGLTPAAFLGVAHERGRIASGGRADFVLLGSDLNVSGVWIGGRRIH